ncbi:ERVV2 protein, partial [Semnornis frantzii]|nr:ERVV2 protein [Semnornis frantzii]
FHSFVRWFIPDTGVSELEKAIVNISAVMEKINNRTIDAIQALQEEIVSLKQVTVQNRTVLDLLTAKEGEVCIVLNQTCCVYIDESKRVETDVS